MSITTIDSYLTTSQEILDHWTEANTVLAALGMKPLTLQGGYDHADFSADRIAVRASIGLVRDTGNTQRMARKQRTLYREALGPRLAQFRAAVKTHLPNTGYAAALPKQPTDKAREERFLTPFEVIADLWARIDADTGIPGFTPPLTLAGGYTQSELKVDLNGARGAFATVATTAKLAQIHRKDRNARLRAYKKRMLQYRSAVQSQFPADHPIAASLPLVTTSTGSSSVREEAEAPTEPVVSVSPSA